MLAAYSETVGEIAGLNTLNAPYLIFYHFSVNFLEVNRKVRA